jgi:ribosome modulation factor
MTTNTPNPDGGQPPTVKAVLAAQQDGYEHGFAGNPPTRCPYTPGDQLLREWTAGWAAGRTDAREQAGLAPET